MRLIDADKLYKHLNDWAFAEAPTDLDVGEVKFEREVIYKTINDCMRAVDEQPTAYDVSKVIERLRCAKNPYSDINLVQYNNALDLAIYIVEKGAE